MNWQKAGALSSVFTVGYENPESEACSLCLAVLHLVNCPGLSKRRPLSIFILMINCSVPIHAAATWVVGPKSYWGFSLIRGGALLLRESLGLLLWCWRML